MSNFDISDESLKNFTKDVDDSKWSLESYKSYLESTGQSTSTFANITSRAGSAIKSVGGILLSTFANVAVMWAASAALQFIITKADEFIHRQEIAIEKGEEAQSAISDIATEYNNKTSSLSSLGSKFVDDASSIEDTGDAIESVTKKYSELSKGVDLLNNKNVSLNDEEYQNFLDISNQLAEVFPSLVTGYDANGNAILNLGTNAENAAQKLTALLEAERNAAHFDIAENIQTDYEGIVAKSEQSQKEIEKYNKNIKDLKLESDSLTKGLAVNDYAVTFDKNNKKQYEEAKKIYQRYGLYDESKNPIANIDSRTLEGEYVIRVSPKINNLDQESRKKLQTELDSIYSSKINENLQKKQSEELKNENYWKSLIPDIQSYLQTEATFSSLNSTLQDAIIGQLSNLNISSISEDYAGDIEDFLYGEIITPINDLAPEMQNSLSQLFSLDKNTLSFSEYKKSFNKILDSTFGDNEEQKSHWSKLLGLDEMQSEYEDKIDLLRDNITKENGKLKNLSGEDLEIAYDLVLNDKFSGTYDELIEEIKKKKQTLQKEGSVDIEALIAKDGSTFTTAKNNMESANKGDTYDSMYEMAKKAKELLKSGDVGTDDFKSIAKMFSPSGADDYKNFEENLGKINRYFTEDNSGVKNFLKDLEKNDFAQYNEDTKEWTYSIEDLEAAAYKMGMGFEPFMAMFGKLEDKGFNNDFFATEEEGVSHLKDLSEQLYTAEQELYDLQNNPETKNNTSAIKAKEEEVQSLKERIEETTNSLDILLNKSPDDYAQEDKRNKEASKSLRKSYNENKDNLSENARKEWANDIITSTQGTGYDAEYLGNTDRLTTKKKNEKNKKIVEEYQNALSAKELDPSIYVDLSKVKDAADDAKMSVEEFLDAYSEDVEPIDLKVNTDSLDELADDISKEDAQEKVVTLIGEDNATPIIENWDSMDPVDKETNLTAKDRATAILNLWNGMDANDKFATMTGQDRATYLVQIWNNLTPEEKQAVLNGDSTEIDNVLNNVEDVEISKEIPITETGGSNVISTLNRINNISLDPKTQHIYQVTHKSTVNGSSNNSGTKAPKAHGTLPAYANGSNVTSDGRLRRNEEAVINEVEKEWVIRNGQILEFNDGYPTKAKLKRGDIVLNHRQVNQLEEKGYVKGSHAKIVGGESAFSNGTIVGNAYAGTGSGGGTIVGNSSSSSSADKKNTNADKKNTKAKDENTKATKKNTDSTSKEATVFDLVAIKLKKFANKTQKIADSITDYVSSAFKTAQLQKQMVSVGNEITANEKGYTAYMKKADSVKISSAWKQRIQQGNYSIKEVKNETLAKKIEKYQDYYDKAIECKQAVTELKNTQLELFEQWANMPTEKAEKAIDKLVKKYNILDSYVGTISSGGSSAAALISSQASIVNNAKNSVTSAQATVNSTKKAKVSAKNKVSQKASAILSNKTLSKKLSSSQKKAMKAGKTVSTKGLSGNALKQVQAYNSLVAQAQSASSAYNSAKSSLSTATSNYNQLMSIYGIANQNANQPSYMLANALVDQELSNQKQQDAQYQAALVQANNNLSASQSKLSSANAAKVSSANKVSNKASKILSNKNITKQLSASQKASLKAGKTVSTKGLSRNALKQIRAYNALVAQAQKAAQNATTAHQQYNIALEAQQTAAENAATSAAELAQAIVEAEKQKFDNIKSYYEAQISYRKALNEQEEKSIELAKAHGDYAKQDDYTKQIQDTQEELKLAQEEATKLTAQLNASVASGVIKQGSEEWLDLKTQIIEAENAVKDYGIEIENLNQEALEAKYAEMFDRAIEQADKYIDKLETINGIITDEMMYDADTGELTELGVLSLTLNTRELNQNLSNLQQYVKKRQEIINDYNAGKFGDEKYAELLEKVESNINSTISDVSSSRDTILSIIKEQGQAEVDAIHKAIDARKELLQKKKDYYDYDKTLKSKTKDIQLLEQQIRALDGVTDAESRAQKVRLEAQLQEAKDDLDDTVKEHIYELQVTGLDELSDKLDEDYEKYVNELSSNLEKMTEAINNAINATAENTANALSLMAKLLEPYGVTPEQIGITGLASGTKYVQKSGTYLTNEEGREIIVTKHGILQELDQGDGVVPHDLTERLFEMAETYPVWKSQAPQVLQPDIKYELNRDVAKINPIIECPITIMGNADEQNVINAVKKAIPLISKTVQTDVRKDLRKAGWS